MSASNTTTNYNLSQFVSTDIPSWLGDYNGDMLKIDAGINAAKLAADSAALAASSAQNDATSALNNVGTLATTVGTLSNTVGTAVGNINTINSLIGNGTPTTTDQTIIGAINELHADQGDLTTLTTTDKTSLVAAINEIAGLGLIAEVTADGVKTNEQLFNELYSLIRSSGVDTHKIAIKNGDNWYHVNYDNGSEIWATSALTGPSGIGSNGMTLKASGSVFTVSSVSNTYTTTDYSSSVIAAGTKIKAYV